jgi:hypothetical protein
VKGLIIRSRSPRRHPGAALEPGCEGTGAHTQHYECLLITHSGACMTRGAVCNTQDLGPIRADRRPQYNSMMLEEFVVLGAMRKHGLTQVLDVHCAVGHTNERPNMDKIATNWKSIPPSQPDKASLLTTSSLSHMTTASDGTAFNPQPALPPLLEPTTRNFRCNRPRKTISSLRTASCYITSPSGRLRCPHSAHIRPGKHLWRLAAALTHRFRFRYVLHPWTAEYSHWMRHEAIAVL